MNNYKFTIQPNAVVSKKHPISPYILLTFHGGSFLYLFFLALYTSGFQYSGNTKIVTISGCLYISFVILNYLVHDRIPYPFLRYVNPLLAIILIALLVFILSSLYVMICKRYYMKMNEQQDDKNKIY